MDSDMFNAGICIKKNIIINKLPKDVQSKLSKINEYQSDNKNIFDSYDIIFKCVMV